MWIYWWFRSFEKSCGRVLSWTGKGIESREPGIHEGGLGLNNYKGENWEKSSSNNEIIARISNSDFQNQLEQIATSYMNGSMDNEIDFCGNMYDGFEKSTSYEKSDFGDVSGDVSPFMNDNSLECDSSENGYHDSYDAFDSLPILCQKGEKAILRGRFGEVYIGINNYSGELVAINQFQIPNTENTTIAVALQRRIKELQRLQHVNIVQYLGTSIEGQTFNIFEEFVSGWVSLASMLKPYQFHEPLIKRYTTQILIGVTFLHERNIVHQSIKGENILVDGNGVIKLREFGTAGLISELIGNSVVTDDSFLWMAPEVLSGFNTKENKQDIWSIGCTVVEMVTRKPPWMDQYPNIVSAKQSIGATKGGPPIPDNLSQHGKDFLSLCFSMNPYDRPTGRQLQQHPWLQQSSPLQRNSPTEPLQQQYNPMNTTHEFGGYEVNAFQDQMHKLQI